MSVNTFTADQLYVSEHNVRTDADAIAATGPLEESIAAVGLFFPLIVHPAEDGRYGVLDGGRRYRAIYRLIKAGRLAADWPIECVVREGLPADITEQSLGAFLLARDLHPYETNAAVARAAEQGHAPVEIARNLGQTLRWVNQQLRLGRLAPEIFAAYAEGRLSTDLAQAYAATEDEDLQRRAFAHFTGPGQPAYNHHPRAVRQFFKVGDHELAKLLHFVGEDIYRAAGGRFELDLFADEAEVRGRVTDESKLRELAENKLGLLKHDLRRRTGSSDLRFVAEPPQFSGRTDYTLEIKPGTRGDKLRLPAGDLVCSIDIAGDGEPLVRWWWASRKAKAAAERAAAKPAPEPSDPGGNWRPEPPVAPRREVREGAALDPRNYANEAQNAREAVREEHGLGSAGLHVVRSLRRELLRALLVLDAETGGDLARDYLTWAQLRLALTSDRASAVGAQGLSSAMELIEEREPAEVRPHLDACEAHAVWTRACETIAAQDFITEPDPAQALSAYVAAGPDTKALAEAVLAGLALLRSANTDGWRIAAHDRLAQLAGGSDDALRALWSPEPEFLALFSKAQRIALAEPHFGPSVTASWSKLKDEDLAQAAARAFAGNPLSTRQLRWVHPLLSFGANAPADAATKEAAE